MSETGDRCQHCNEPMVMRTFNNTRYYVCLACMVSGIAPAPPSGPVEGHGTAPAASPATTIADDAPSRSDTARLAMGLLGIARQAMSDSFYHTDSRCELARAVLRVERSTCPGIFYKVEAGHGMRPAP